MDQQKGHISNLLEDVWFFGNTLKNKSKTPKTMVRCNSDPCPCSSSNNDRNASEISNNALNRAPSLPVSLDKNTKYELVEEVDDDYEPRMGDLIRQAMPMPMPMPMPMSSRRLERTPSLPPLRRASDASSIVLNVENGRKLSGKLSVDSSSLVQEKSPNPIAMVKLSRRASIDSSMVLPPRYTSKGTKQSGSNSKNKTPKKLDQSNAKTIPKVHQPKTQTIDNKTNSQKSFSDSETDELQRFKDLNLSLGNKIVTQKLPTLQRRASLDSTQPEISKLRRPYVPEAWQKPLVPKWGDQKASSSQQDMKDQIKFWARAVASNVRQEC